MRLCPGPLPGQFPTPNQIRSSQSGQACVKLWPKDWYATIYDPVFKTYSLGDLQFNIGLMNDDFSGPAESTRFLLGSIIPIMASVVQETHQPLLLLLDECVAATTPELYPESTMYPIISNKG
ncbi:hypothetical protein KUCAC02_027831, partial [Chaenocephalus aceratus]